MEELKGKDLLRILVIACVIITAIGALIMAALKGSPDVFLGAMGGIAGALFLTYMCDLWD